MPSEAVLLAFFVIGIQLMVIVAIPALGEAIAEQSGVLNVGIEGVMLIGAFVTAVMTVNYANLPGSVLAAVGAGVVCGVVLAGLYVWRGTDQIVTGLMFNIFALGLTGVLHSRYLAGQIGPTLPTLSLPVLDDIPWVGEVLGQQNVMLYGLVALAIGTYLLLRRTWWGLYARASGERPLAAESGGLDVVRLRTGAVILACVLAALGGAALVLGTSGGFVPGMTAGRGFIALGIVVLARWRPLWIVIYGLLFGLTQALQFLAPGVEALSDVPRQVWLALPYVATLLAVVFAPGSRYPAAVGIPYRTQREAI